MPVRAVPDLLASLAPLAVSSPEAAAGRPEAEELVALATDPSTAAEVDRQARAALVGPLGRLLRGGWRPDEVERVVSLRCTGPLTSALFADVTLLLAEDVDPWLPSVLHRSLDPRIGVATLAALIEVLTSLQPLPLFDASDDADLDQGVLRKVRALLAKAESTDFVAEAEALTAKAQDLITHHALDGLDLDPTQRREVRSRRIALDAPYASAKSILLTEIAAANRCRSVQCRFTQTAIVVGVPADLTAVEVLYTSLLTQATSAMLSPGPVTDGLGRSRTKSFRRSFLLGFAQRIGARLAEASSAALASSPSTSLLPALQARSVAVDEAMREAFPSLQVRRVVHSNRAGYGAGDRAGSSADIDGPRVRGPRGSLTA